ncbi:EF-P lysine aminoacylase GenX [Candidatus Gracilibacteria bacterium]|nr:EF-P lysine aminoacylase GenX [Candidatus Gracilibacteria bacterium]
MHEKLITDRARITQRVRDFFTDNNFLEVETPIMVDIPGMEPHLTPFETTDGKFLNHSPELQMKKLLGQGLKRIFNITKVFRSGEKSNTHNPEFTMLEWYRLNADYKDMMTDCENLITSLTDKYSKPFKRKTCQELFQEHLQIDLTSDNFAEEAAKHIDVSQLKTWDEIFFKLFLNFIEPNLGPEPIFVTDYPASQAALAKTKGFFAERFELYINGLELANAFSELTDATEQRHRLEEEQEERRQMNKTVFPIDEEFLSALDSIPEAAGIALGLDRLIMVLLDKKTIQEVILFSGAAQHISSKASPSHSNTAPG